MNNEVFASSFKIEDYTKNLSKDGEIWRTGQTASISYPASGSNFCYSLEDESFWFQARNRIISHFVHCYSKPGPIFDIGGGNGCVTKYLQDRGVNSILIEPSLEGCHNAVKRGVNYVINSSLEDDSLIHSKIQNAGLFDVLEHIEDDHAFLARLNRLLDNEGKLFLTVPAGTILWSVEDRDAGHFRRYNKTKLKSILIEHGFRIVFCSHIFAYMFPLIFFMRSIPSKMGVYKSNITRLRTQLKPGRLAVTYLKYFEEIEFTMLNKDKNIPFGSTLLIIAEKHGNTI